MLIPARLCPSVLPHRRPFRLRCSRRQHCLCQQHRKPLPQQSSPRLPVLPQLRRPQECPHRVRLPAVRVRSPVVRARPAPVRATTRLVRAPGWAGLRRHVPAIIRSAAAQAWPGLQPRVSRAYRARTLARCPRVPRRVRQGQVARVGALVDSKAVAPVDRVVPVDRAEAQGVVRDSSRVVRVVQAAVQVLVRPAAVPVAPAVPAVLVDSKAGQVGAARGPVARPLVPSAAREVVRLAAANPSERSAKSSTTCRRRRWVVCGLAVARGRPSGSRADRASLISPTR